MVILLEIVATYTMCLVGIWWRKMMLCYLHTPSDILTQGLAEQIIQHSMYALITTEYTYI